MELKNKIELIMENFEKCHVVLDNDCPLGQLYDYSCAFQAFILGKMQEAQRKEEPQKVEEVEQPKQELPEE